MSGTLGDLLASTSLRDMHGRGAPLPSANADTDATVISVNADGSVDIDLDPDIKSSDSDGPDVGEHRANLALDDDFVGRVPVTALLQDIEGDIQARQSWIEQRDQGRKMLALVIEEPRGDTGNSSAPLEGMSTVRSGQLLEACLKFQANARGELLPATGPVKVQTYSGDSITGDELAEALERDLNMYLTAVATEYYPDTDRMLFEVGFSGSGFKKVYHCPLKRRPVSLSVDAVDLIVDPAATDLGSARRITHRVHMRDSMVKRMQLNGTYRDIGLGSPQPDAHASDTGIDSDIQGLDPSSSNMENIDRTLYECLTELDLGEVSGLPVPYRVTIDVSSQQVLEIRRNWQEDDPNYMPEEMYVRYPYVDAIGIYAIGLLNIVGNVTKAQTAALRESLDAGMFASFPGFLYSDEIASQESNEFRVPPGGGVRINTGSQKISDVVMPVPYKDATPGLLKMIEMLDQMGGKLTGAADIPVGQGTANAPVGTIMAMIDQQTKIMSAVHKRLHTAQAKEFQLLVERFREDPAALWRHQPKRLSKWTEDEFLQALENYEIGPVADPNMPTHTHRLMQVQALVMMAQQNPGAFDIDHVTRYALRMLNFANPDEFMADRSQPKPPSPEEIKAQLEQQKLHLEVQQLQQDGQIAQGKAQVDMAKVQGDAAKTQMELQKAQMEQDTDMAELQGVMDVDRDKLHLERQGLGADIIHKTRGSMVPPDAQGDEKNA